MRNRRHPACVLLLLAFFLSKAQSLYFPPLSGSAWDTVSPQTLSWCQPRIDSLYNYLQAKHSKAFIILKNGKIVLEKYFGTYTVDSVFYWASASKSLASFITGIAQEKGFITINDTVSQDIGSGWTSEAPNKENLITIKHLLTMTSGLDDSAPPPCGNDDTAKACLIYKANAGTRWGYQTGAYKKVQDAVSDATGQNYNLVTNNWVKLKTGMSGTWIDQTFYSRAREMARYGLLILNKGIWSGDTLLKDSLYYKAMINTSQNFNLAYGYLWWLNGKASYLTPQIATVFNGPLIPNAPANMFCALGKNDQKIYIVPGDNLVVIRQGPSAEGTFFALSDFDNNLWAYINQLNCATVSLAQVDYLRLISVYPNPASNQLTIHTELSMKSLSLENIYGQSFPMKLVDNSINISQLPNGSYVLKIVLAEGGCFFKKVVISE